MIQTKRFIVFLCAMCVLMAGFLAILLDSPTLLAIHPVYPLNSPLPPPPPDDPEVVTHTVYLPMIANRPYNIIGAETDEDWDHAITNVVQSGARFIRVAALQWDAVQQISTELPGLAVSNTYIQPTIEQAARDGVRTILVIRGVPLWASATNKVCGPVASGYYTAFANFVLSATQFYSAAPYFVKYYEIFNEPDQQINDTGVDWVGCWPHGYQYTAAMKVVYDTVHPRMPDVKLVSGGMYTPPPSSWYTEALTSGLTTAVDYLGFHAYDDYDGGHWWQINSVWWNGTAAGNAWKNMPANKPLMLTENAMRRGNAFTPTSYTTGFLHAESYYVAVSAAWSVQEQLGAHIHWRLEYYNDPSFSTELFNADNTPTPVFTAFQTLNAMMTGATPLTYTYATTVTRLQFSKGEGKLWQVYSKNDTSYTMPVTPTQILDVWGNDITPGTPTKVLSMSNASNTLVQWVFTPPD